MRVRHVAITVGHMGTATKKVALYNKECGKCTVSVDGGVLMIYVNMNQKSKLQFLSQLQLVQRSSPPSRIVKLLTDIPHFDETGRLEIAEVDERHGIDRVVQ